MKVYIDSSCDILYSSFYIYGLYSIYGRQDVKFSSQYFKQFKHNNHFFAFVIVDEQYSKKIVIDFTDSKTVDLIALDWCDVYGKINLETGHDVDDKIIAIGPSFGIRIFGLFETLKISVFNLLKSWSRIPNKRRFLSDYKSQYKRPKYSDYQSQPSKTDYVFFMASLWKQEPLTNTYRANFIKSCQLNSSIRFEGGFAPRIKNDIKGFEAITTNARIKMTLYLQRIKHSVFVFNTPAVKDCHGWKLAEYLCLGKAIITTPLSRVMPGQFENHTHFLLSTGEIQDISKQMNSLLLVPQLRQKLEAKSLSYFKMHLAPEIVIKRLVRL